MLRLAVATDAETLDRIADPLAERGIEARYVPTTGRAQPLSEPLVEEGFDAGFVYPSRVMEGGVADALLGVPWVNDRAAVLRSRNKAETLARLGRAGVPTPESVYVSNPAADSELRAAFEQLDPPVLVKPNSTTRGVGIAKADDLDSLFGICEYLSLVHDYRAVDDKSFLVQEFLPAARDFRAMVVDGEYAGAVERRLPADEREAGRWKHNVHRGATAVGVDLAPERRELAEAAAEALDIEWLGVDLLVAEGHAVVNETNARPTVDSAAKYDPEFYGRLAGLIRRTADV
jgi:ribosomal protein S6--L-glutamate ligase